MVNGFFLRSLFRVLIVLVLLNETPVKIFYYLCADLISTSITVQRVVVRLCDYQDVTQPVLQ